MATNGNEKGGAQKARNPKEKDVASARQPITKPAEEHCYQHQIVLDCMLGPRVIHAPIKSAPPYAASSAAIHICTKGHNQLGEYAVDGVEHYHRRD